MRHCLSKWNQSFYACISTEIPLKLPLITLALRKISDALHQTRAFFFIVILGTIYESLRKQHRPYFSCYIIKFEKQCFLTFFGLRHPHLVSQIFGATPGCFIKCKYQGNCNYWRHPWNQLTAPLCAAAPQLGIPVVKR